MKRRILAGLLALVMLLGCVPAMSVRTMAVEPESTETVETTAQAETVPVITEEGIPEETAPTEGIAPAETTPAETVPETIPEETIPTEVTTPTEGTAPVDTTPTEGTTTVDTTPTEGATPVDAVPTEGTTPTEEPVPEETQAVTPAETTPENSTPTEETIAEITEEAGTENPVSGVCGETLTWTLDEAGTLTISGTGDMWDFSAESPAPWYGVRERILEAVIEDGVTRIGDYAFSDCASLANVTFPEGIAIGAEAFSGCPNLILPETKVSTTETTAPTADTMEPTEESTEPEAESAAEAADGPETQTIQIPFRLNPLYQGILDSSIFAQPMAQSNALAANALPNYLTEDEAAVAVRSYLKNRTESFTVYITSQSDAEAILDNVFSVACAHTGAPTEGDYLRFQYAGYSASAVISSNVNYTFDITVSYYTSAQQEAQMDSQVSQVLSSLSLSGKSDYHKVQAIYDYICNHVTYDYANLNDESHTLKFTAYAALCNGTAVCQGYATLLYRLALEVGVDCRVVSGIGNGGNHAWNVIRLDGQYYNADATWDAGQSPYRYFLKCDANFPDHTPANGFAVAATDYVPKSETESIVASGTCGDNLTWTLDEAGTLTISGTGAMEDFYDGAPWNNKQKNIKSVVISDGITSISYGAFSDCSGLTSVSIPDSVTSIGGYAFYYCSNLTSVAIPDGVTNVGYGAFSDCSSLANVNIPDGVTSIEEYAFDGCSSLTSVTIPESVTSIGDGAFSGCSSLSNVTIPDSVTSIDRFAFSQCSSLTSMTIPESVVSIGHSAFSECSSLTSVSIPDGVTSIEDCTFDGCSNLTSVTIPESVTSIGTGAFSGCRSLISVTIPGGVTVIEDYTFSCCSSLTSITIPKSIGGIGNGAFLDCEKLSTITFQGDAPEFFGEDCFENVTATAYYPANNSTWTEDVLQNYGGTITWVAGSAVVASGECGENLTWTLDEAGALTISGTGAMEDYGYRGAPWYDEQENIKSVVISNGVTSIGDYAFYDCSSLTSVTIPDGVTSIGWYAFSDCSSLTSVTIPDGVTSIGWYAFSGCSSLTSVTIPDGVTSIEYCAFARCSSLTNVTIPNSVTSIGGYAFSDCSSLTSVIIPNGVTSIGYCSFSSCYKLASVTIPDSVTSIGSYAFSGCESLTSVTIPNSVTNIGDSAFSWCTSLTSITIPSSVTNIGDSAFSWCTSLTSITIPSSVTSIGVKAFSHVSGIWVDPNNLYYCSDDMGALYNKDKTALLCAPGAVTAYSIPNGITSIGDYAFYCCDLTSVTIPDSVTSIGDYAFSSCNLTSVTIPASVTSIGEKALESYSLKTVYFWGDPPEVSAAVFRWGYNESETITCFYPADNANWTEEAKQSLNPDGEAILEWIPFGGSLATSGSCGAGLTWDVDQSTYTLTISGTGEMDTWDWKTSVAPWVSHCGSIRIVVIEPGVASISEDAFRNTSVSAIRFRGDAPAMGMNLCSRGGEHPITAYYPAGNDTYGEAIQNYSSMVWIQEGSAFSELGEVYGASDTMTSDEIRAAVQGLDQAELVESLRSSWKAREEYSYLDSAIRTAQTGIVISPEIPGLYGSTASFVAKPTTYGASLNDLLSGEGGTTLTFGKSSSPIPVPEGYNSADAIQFSLSLGNVQNPQHLKAPVVIDYLYLPDYIDTDFVSVFWRNSETGAIEQIPTSLSWSKIGNGLSFVITGTGDYVITTNGGVGGACGDNLTWKYDEANKALTFSGSGEMYDYGENNYCAPWRSYCSYAFCDSELRSIVLEEGVTSIGSYAFYECRWPCITIPASVRSIGTKAFAHGSDYYYQCPLVFKGDAPSIAEDSFAGMLRIVAYYPGGNASWESIVAQSEWGGGTFSWIPVSAEGTCGENLTWMFDESTGTLTIRGSGEMTLSYPEDGYSFFPIIPWAAYENEITGVVLEEGVTTIDDYAFSGCSKMTRLDIPDSVFRIGYGAINATSMKELTIPAGVTELGMEDYGGMGIGIADFDRINVAEGNSAYSSVDGVLFNKDKTALLCLPRSMAGEYVVPEGVTNIGEGAIYDCQKLRKLTLPSTLITIDQRAIDYCNDLQELVIPDSVTAIRQCGIESCYGLTTVIVGTGLTEYGKTAIEWCGDSTIQFRGNAPVFDELAFGNNTVTVYYPADNPTWTEDVLQDYGGTITWVPATTHSILEGANATVQTNEPLAVRIDCDMELFTGVLVDGEQISEDCYTVTEGSTIVTLLPEYLQTLSAGDHTLLVSFKDGFSSTTFTIEEPAETADINGDGAINVDDVFYLAMHISAPGVFAIPWKSADANGDGAVNVDDVFYLAMHISAPQVFSLFPNR